MATNVEGPLFLNQLLSKKLINGRVLNMGSAVAYFPVTGGLPIVHRSCFVDVKPLLAIGMQEHRF